MQEKEAKIKENVVKAFEDFPETDTVYATSDGQVFLNKNRAELHATPKGKVYPYNRSDFVQKEEPLKEDKAVLNAKSTVEAIKEATTLDELKAFEDDTRKTVLEALDKRKAELLEELEVTSESVTGSDVEKQNTAE